MKENNKRVVSFILCLSMVAVSFLFPITSMADGSCDPGTIFSDGDADHVYFAGDTLTFNLTDLPGITMTLPAQVAFGLIGPGESFVPTNIFTSGTLTAGGAGGGYYINRVITTAGSTFSLDITGTIASNLPTGALAVQVWADTNGPADGGWTNLLAAQPPYYLPLTDGDPALVGIDTALAAVTDVTCDPELGSRAQSDEDLYDINITFKKDITPGVTGSISFTHLNLFDSYEDLQSLDEGINMDTTTPAITGEECFVLGIDQSTLGDLADDGATISVSSAAFSSVSVTDFDAEAVSGDDSTISNLTKAGNVVSFDVTHFSDYKLTKQQLQARIDQAKTIIGSSFTAVEGADGNLLESLQTKEGMSATGVEVSSIISKTPSDLPITLANGEITYNSTHHSGSVTLELSYNGLTDSAILTTVTVPVNDTEVPVPGNSGTISASSVGSNSLVLNWTAASDNISPTTALKYHVIKSTSDNIHTGSEAESNGTLLTDDPVENITSYSVTGLSPSTTYYFNIAARDRAGKWCVYNSMGVTTAALSDDDGNGGGGGGKTPAVPATPTTKTSTKENTLTSTTTVTGTLDSATGKSTAALTGDTFAPMLVDAKAAETSGQQAVVQIKVNSAAQTKTIAVEIPKASFNQVAQETKAQVSVTSPLGTVTFNEAAVQAINNSAQTGDIQISIAKVDTAALSTEVQNIVGDGPVFNFSVKAGTGEVSQFGGGSVDISIPYTLKSGEDANSVVVYYINAAGELETVRGAYDAATKTFRFVTSHFSKYAIAYNEVNFDDVSANAWYQDAVSFIAARKITTGTDGNSFSPNAKLTRAQFLVMVMKAYGIEPAANTADNFSDAGNTWYTVYLAEAKTLGLTNGDGNNLFNPNKSITRQDMFTMLYRTLGVIGELPESTDGKTLADFIDADSVKDYAKTPIEAFVSAGIITGNYGLLAPQSTSTRAEMAQVLFNLLSK